MDFPQICKYTVTDYVLKSYLIPFSRECTAGSSPRFCPNGAFAKTNDHITDPLEFNVFLIIVVLCSYVMVYDIPGMRVDLVLPLTSS